MLAAAPRYLTREDWREIDRAFCDNQDPLFGARPAQDLGWHHQRIANLAPAKLRPLFAMSTADSTGSL